MSEIKLLPCPFCGGEAGIIHYGNNRASTRYECFGCGCSLETGETFNYGKHWNERYTLPDDLRADVLALCDYAKKGDRVTATDAMKRNELIDRISERLRGSELADELLGKYSGMENTDHGGAD